MIQFPTNVRDPKFVEKLTLYDNQAKQDAANQKVHDEYLQYSASYLQANTAAAANGVSIDAPKPVPLMTVYNDNGTVSHPPFPDLVLPMIDPKSSVPTTGPGFGSLNPTGATTDLLAIQMMLQHIIGELDAIKTKVGA